MESGDQADTVQSGVSQDSAAEDSAADAGAETNGQASATAGTPRANSPRDPLAKPRDLASATKQSIRYALLTASRPTASARILPGFLMVGPPRCGTTSMYDTLSQHPAVAHPLLSWTREVHYFDNNYHRGMAWYQSHFPLRARAARAAHAVGAQPMAFESSPYYILHPLAPERILRDLPGVKLMVQLRDPIERAFSSHAYSISVGCDTETFERALELEDSRLEGEVERLMEDPSFPSLAHRHHSYRTRGHYVDHLEHLEKLFGRDRIHVVDSADFFTDPKPTYDGVLKYLGLPNVGYPDFKHLNARSRPAPMPDSVRAELEDHFRPYNERLIKWLGWKPSWCR
ncbi:MAG: sulfotransferase domain-containing protein [Streptosporangiaceae bacterium]